MHNAQSESRADGEVFPEATNGEAFAGGRQADSGVRFTPLCSDFGPFSAVSLTRCMQRGRLLCGRSAIQADCGKQSLAAPGCVNSEMVNCISSGLILREEPAFFDREVRKSAAG